jgi:hypothetical protein
VLWKISKTVVLKNLRLKWLKERNEIAVEDINLLVALSSIRELTELL